MHIEKTALDGVVIIEPDVFSDERGFFMESYNATRYREIGIQAVFVQDNLSVSKKGVLRGLHYQAPPMGQSKLVQVTLGKALDVVVDIRSGSPTYGKYVTVELSSENHRQLFIPEGFAHGFVALEDDTLFQYKCTNVYSKEHERGILWNDSALGIAWGVSDPIVATKDQAAPLLKDIPHEFVFKTN